jgi:hypothetical protein
MPEFWPYSAPMTKRIPFRLKAAVTAAAVLALAGCSQRGTSELLNDSSSTQMASANPDLSMPPDLRLPAPGSGPAVSAAPAPAKSYAAPKTYTSAKTASPVTGASAAAAQPQGDIYDQYGISKVNPDGTQKTGDQLRAELRKAILAKKRESNPSYGTISNIGNIFSGG